MSNITESIRSILSSPLNGISAENRVAMLEHFERLVDDAEKTQARTIEIKISLEEALIDDLTEKLRQRVYGLLAETREEGGSARSLIASEISDFLAGINCDCDIDQEQLIKQVLACLPRNFGYNKPTPVTWLEAQDITDHPDVDEAIRNFSEDVTGDNGCRIVLAVMKVLNNEC